MPEESHQLKFLLGNQPIALELDHHPEYHPSTTVLNYLRSLPGFKGVKEGCAEGDCGACTVVVASLNEMGRLEYNAINSCLVFLPWLHGKQLITVEHLAKGRDLHPVQQSMVDLYGSQCGFCTPGIVMSLFALHKNSLTPTRENAISSLSGNLCRCTGYQPILEAAMLAISSDGYDQFSNDETLVIDYLKPLQGQSLKFLQSQQEYFRPVQLTEALDFHLLHPEFLIASGATDIALKQSKKHEFLPKILDISAIRELKTIEEKNDCWIIGSGVSFQQLNQPMAAGIPMIQEVCKVFASQQIRNLATLGGNIGSASPIGDSLPVLIALEADVVLISKEKSRQVSMEQFILGYRKTDLLPGELIGKIIIRKPSPDSKFRYFKVSKRRELDISTVSLAAHLNIDNQDQIVHVILTFGGMAEKPVRTRITKEWLLGRAWTPENAEKASELLKTELFPISDARSGKEGRNLMASNLLLKLFIETKENGGENE
ncbi:MAG: xanthine dehydrogenase small subunit [Bacteroidales bacterium]|nr:xanthine dehydrogenase small subunit [Bacteroidales bacterium]